MSENSTTSDGERIGAAATWVWASGGAKVLGGAALATGGLVAIPLLVGAGFYALIAGAAAKKALSD